MYRSLKRLMKDGWNRSYLEQVECWENLTEVVGELNELMPLLISTEPEMLQASNHVQVLIKSDGPDTYVICASYERGADSTVIGAPGFDRGAAHTIHAHALCG